jgi:hypothetical protein
MPSRDKHGLGNPGSIRPPILLIRPTGALWTGRNGAAWRQEAQSSGDHRSCRNIRIARSINRSRFAVICESDLEGWNTSEHTAEDCQTARRLNNPRSALVRDLEGAGGSLPSPPSRAPLGRAARSHLSRKVRSDLLPTRFNRRGIQDLLCNC